MSGRRALVTGASSGIGLDIARYLAAKGFDLVLTARSRDTLERVAAQLVSATGVDVRVHPADLAQPNAAHVVFDAIAAGGLTVDVLVNNAGFAMYGPFVEADERTQLDLLQVNVIALTQLTGLFLPGMLQRRSGRILNVSSTAAFYPGPLMAIYYASKSYVLLFSEALNEEVRGSGVTATALCPGATRSGFQKRAAMENSRLVAGDLLESAYVARQGVDAMLRGQSLVIPGFKHQLIAMASRFGPRTLMPRVVKLAQAPVRDRS